MNAAWGMICGYHEIALFLDEDHKTTKNIFASKAFTVSLADQDHLVAADYVGLVSGNKVPDKFEKAGFHAIKSEFVDAPLIAELEIALECRLISYDPESGKLTGEIVNVSVDESVLDGDGKVDTAKAAPITFDPFNGTYLVLGDKVGNAFRDGAALK